MSLPSVVDVVGSAGLSRHAEAHGEPGETCSENAGRVRREKAKTKLNDKKAMISSHSKPIQVLLSHETPLKSLWVYSVLEATSSCSKQSHSALYSPEIDPRFVSFGRRTIVQRTNYRINVDG
jgi:hypothetical protein